MRKIFYVIGKANHSRAQLGQKKSTRISHMGTHAYTEFGELHPAGNGTEVNNINLSENKQAKKITPPKKSTNHPQLPSKRNKQAT